MNNDGISTDGEGSFHGSDAYLDEWIEWEEFVYHQEGRGSVTYDGSANADDAMVCVGNDAEVAATSMKARKTNMKGPSMPCTTTDSQHVIGISC